MRTIIAEEGVGGVWKGVVPTLLGYSVQGLFKFGLYEYLKDYYSTLVGEENAKKYKGLIWLAGSASAEFVADIGLCPMEMVKVKIQTSPAGTFPLALGPAVAKMQEMKAETRFPFGSVVPLWSRQIPYTMAKFFFFEKVRVPLCSVTTLSLECRIKKPKGASNALPLRMFSSCAMSLSPGGVSLLYPRFHRPERFLR